MNTSCTLTGEIQKIAGMRELDTSLRKIGLLNPDDPLSALLPIRDWYRSAAETYGLLVNAGFAPMSVRDWRSRGHDVVLVDFGQDLGPAGIAIDSESGVLSEVLDNLSRDAVDLSANELRLI
jgi:hypothetical protein